MHPARPTLRCLRNDLKLPVPPANKPLDELEHPLLAKASEQFADSAAKHERIRAIDDQIFFKVKVQRWRGAVWVNSDLPWLVVAGWRENGSAEDFYAALESDAKTARAQYNENHSAAWKNSTYTQHLLPERADFIRYRTEAGVRFIRRIQALIRRLVCDSLRDGYEHSAELDTFTLGIQVRADAGHETYVAIRIIGSVPQDLTAIILKNIPGCDRDAWFPEYALPNRDLLPAEQVWSNLMDPVAAAELFED